ncbi:MFS general substrate transporter [Pisolithus thermaeus]|nr:MFS general substrate transporter [Pisolithus croceorrhizus]KAI6164837.1 MFS general substrate transporter [Pisolithus thermaeus]
MEYQRLSNTEIYPDVEEYTPTLVDADPEPNRRREVERKLLRKLDLRVWFLVLVYIMNYMDRNNMAAARLKGLEEDLRLTGQEFNTLISVLFIGYGFMQIPSNIYLNRIRRPSLYLSCCVFLWGIISIGTGHFREALASRFFLGFSEAVYYPGVLLMLSRWYKRDELGLRMAYFTGGSSLANAFGSLIASGVLAIMDGKLGYQAWRWLFFCEGGLTCMIAASAFFVVPDFPTTPAFWLTSEERMLAQKRMEEELTGIDHDSIKVVEGSGLTEALTDWKVWWLAIALAILNIALSYSFFFPTLAATMGFSPTITLLLCAPPWIVALLTSFCVMSHSDRTGDRFWHIVGPVSTGIIGFVMAITSTDTLTRYLSLFFMAQISVSYIVLLAWVSNSIPESSSRRAVGIAFANTLSSISNIASPYVWPAAWGPSYVNSFLICILTATISLFMLWVYQLHLISLNKEAEMNERALGLPTGFRYVT